MKKQWLIILGLVIIISLGIVGMAYAFSVGNVDGVWSQIDVGSSGPDARCSRWASGGTGTSLWSDTWWNQTDWTGTNPGTFDTDENIVVYGRETYWVDNPWSNDYWAQISCEDSDIPNQSGFGFDGDNGITTPPAKTPFYLGAFTHYNNPVFSTNEDGENSQPFNYVDLTVTVPITCNDGSTTTNFSFDVRMTLEETPNGADTCPYGPDRPPAYSNPDYSTHCWDKVTLTQDASSSFTCPDGVYTVNILGFTSEGLGGAPCEDSFNPATVSTEYITVEGQSNHACLWAEIDQPTADLEANKSCQDIDTQEPFYRIQIENHGPGSSKQVVLEDTLPDGANYDSTRGWVSTLTTSLGTYPQGECEVVGKEISCRLLTSLPDWITDPTAVWTVDIPVTWYLDLSKINTVTVSAATADPISTNNTATAECDPTSADLLSFDAISTAEGTLLTWETASEIDTFGFNLYRSVHPDGQKELVNPTIIQSKYPGGGIYSHTDKEVKSGVKYDYWLEDLDNALRTKNEYGPVTVRAFWKFYLPLLGR